MARFKFRMQNILNLKQKLETQAEMRFAEQKKVLNEAIAAKEELLRKRESLGEEALRLRSDALDILEIQNNELSIRLCEEDIILAEQRIKREEATLEMRRKELESIMKERKAQEKLREHAFQQFLKDEAAAESKAIDELTSYSYGQKQQLKEI
ncbi:MAG: flagellar FliJ family protein [Lachnospiraceae bacterium]|nr:flagellar FliJ family protein [Lachnospiraceae bacterium]